MAWLAKDQTGEWMFGEKPIRVPEEIMGFEAWGNDPEKDFAVVELPTGTIFRLIGRELTWEDEPVELTEGALFQPFSADMLNFLLVNSLRFLTEEQRKMLVESLVKPVTDEEIDEQSLKEYFVDEYADQIPLRQNVAWVQGAKWMRERMSR
jgi:hypothetical protein